MKISNKYNVVIDGNAQAKAKKLHGIRKILKHFVDRPDQESSEVYPKFEDGEGASNLKLVCEGEMSAELSIEELKEVLKFTAEDDRLSIDILIKAAKGLPKFIKDCGESVLAVDKSSHAQEIAARKDWREFDRQQNEADNESEIKKTRARREYDREMEKIIRQDRREQRKEEKEEAKQGE